MRTRYLTSLVCVIAIYGFATECPAQSYVSRTVAELEEEAARAFRELPEYSDAWLDRIIQSLEKTEFPTSFTSLQQDLMQGHLFAFRIGGSKWDHDGPDGTMFTKSRSLYQISKEQADGSFYALVVEFLPSDKTPADMLKLAELYFVSPNRKWFRHSGYPVVFPEEEPNQPVETTPASAPH